MIFYQTEFVSVSYNSELMFVYQKWTGFCPDNVFREAIDETFNFMKINNIRKIIADTSEQSIVGPGSQDYVKMKVLEFIESHKELRTAYILQKRSRVRISLQRYLWLIKKEIKDEFFFISDSFAEAVEWIKGF